jgi:hypothetical protein
MTSLTIGHETLTALALAGDLRAQAALHALVLGNARTVFVRNGGIYWL